MDNSQPKLPIKVESRVEQIESIVTRLSHFEQEEVRWLLQVRHTQEFCTRFEDWRNVLTMAVHTGSIAGLSFGLTMGLMAGIAAGCEFGLMAGLSTFATTLVGSGVIFGIFMGATIAFLAKFLMPRIAKNMAQNTSPMFQVDEIELPLPAPEVFEACFTTISAAKGMKLEAADRNEGTIRATTSFTWRSPGESVGVKISQIADNASRVRIYSQALSSPFDFGKNRANIEMLKKAIEDAGQVHALLKME